MKKLLQDDLLFLLVVLCIISISYRNIFLDFHENLSKLKFNPEISDWSVVKMSHRKPKLERVKSAASVLSHVSLKTRCRSKVAEARHRRGIITVHSSFPSQLGLERFHGVGILGFNSPEWFISDIGCILAGWDQITHQFLDNNPCKVF